MAPTAFTPQPAVGEWRDRLVELHVLAEHGDADAAAHAAGWLAVDDAAHDAWHAVERTCHQLRGR